MGQYDEAIAEARRALELDANFGNAYVELAKALTHKGKYREAIAELQKAPGAVQKVPLFLGQLGHAYALDSQRGEAEKIVQDLKDPSNARYGSAYAIAQMQTALGHKDQAFEWLQKACEERHPRVIWLRVDPTWDTLRSDPRFDAILQQMGLADKPTLTRNISEGSTKALSVNEGSGQPIDTLAVLPFENQSPDPQAAYLGDDITYSLTDSLARVRELKVRPYSSASRFNPGSTDVKAAGRELQVQAVLKGSIQKRSEQVVIDVELIHVGEDRRLWGSRYQGKLADRLTLQQRIIQEVPEKLRLSLTGQEKLNLAKLPTQNQKAHELYILGRLEWNKRTRPGLEKSIDLFRQAIDLDANYALAWVGLAEAYRSFPINADSPPKDFVPKAKAAAIKALEVDDQLVEAHVALASIAWSYEWDWSEAERRFQRALALNPNSASVRLGYSQHLRTLGRFGEALANSQRAQELDPQWLNARTVTGKHYYYARQYDAAIEQYRKTLDIDPDFWVAHLLLGQAFAQNGQYGEAITQFQRVRQVPGANLEALPSLGHVYAMIGKTVEAQHVLDELKSLSQQRYVPPYYFALIHAGLGEKEQAFAWLNKACEDRNQLVVWMKDEPMLDSLQGDPRFQKIIADMKFPD
jgi:TolB-like protein/Tfp pilus assembly protein PilF